MRFVTWQVLFIIVLLGKCFGQSKDQRSENDINKIVSEIAHAPGNAAKVSLLYTAGTIYVNRPGSEAADLNEALQFANKALKLSRDIHHKAGEGQSYTLLSQIYREKGDTTSGKQFINQAIELFNGYPAPALAAEAHFEASKYYDINWDAQVRIKVREYATGLKYLEQSDPPPMQLADAYKYMGDLYQCIQQSENALVSLKRALAIYQQLGYTKLQDLYTLLGIVNVQLENMAEGVRYDLLAEKCIEESKDVSLTACQVYYNTAVAYSRLDDYASSFKYYNKALAIARINKNKPAIITSMLGSVTAAVKLRDFKTCVTVLTEVSKIPLEGPYNMRRNTLWLTTYMEMGNLTKAAPYYALLMHDLRPSFITSASVHVTYVAVLRYLYQIKQFSEMQKIISDLERTAVKKPKVFKMFLEQYAYKADSAEHKMVEAMEHQQKATALQIDMMKRNYDKQIASQQVRFDSKKKDQDIAYQLANIKLLTRQNNLQSTALDDQRIIRNLSFAGAALLALLLCLLFNRYQIKQKANRLLEEQQAEINSQNTSLKQLVMEREWLLKEVHHRVKNNLQIVISLLNSQFYNVKDGRAKEVIRESQHRIHSVSLIHQKLYQYDDLSGIKMQDYIPELCNYLQDSFDTYSYIEFKIRIAPIVMDVAEAVPLGLILNEAITNVIKHAFKRSNDEKGTVKIKLLQQSGTVRLEVSDNGSGMAPDFDIQKSRSLGLKLISGLTKQLKGELEIRNEGGLSIIVQMKFAQMDDNTIDTMVENSL